ncbi:MAG: hypothetical protein C4539_10195 [Ignavibacteriales bacterium]|nr:MAG: hypothetical protein C4539_10195 [Ignavibacteriales bacterium]
MKLSFLLFTLLLALSLNLQAQNYGLGNTDPSVFSKYKLPETNLKSIFFNTQLNYRTQKGDYNNVTSYSTSSGSSIYKRFTSSLSPTIYMLMENDDRVLNLSTNISGGYSNYYNKSHSTSIIPNNNPFFNYNYSKQVTFDLNMDVIGNYRNYFTSGDLFYSVGTDLNARITDTKIDDRQGKTFNGTKTQDYYFTMGIGWGRLRNVTPVVSAIRFQERLKQINLLNNDLNTNTIESLAEQFSRQSYYSRVYNRDAKYFWQDIEKTLYENGVSLSGLNMYGSNYLMESLNEIRFSRYEGIIGGVNLQLNYENNFNSEFSRISEQFFGLANAFAEYSHQMNLNSQLRSRLSLSGGPSITKNSEVKQKYLLEAFVGYYYELTDRIVTSATDNLSLSFKNHARQDKSLSNTINLNVNYFIEDHLSLTASYSFYYNEGKYSEQKTVNNENYVSLGLTYFIDRAFIYL